METLEPTSLPKIFVVPQLLCQHLTVFCFGASEIQRLHDVLTEVPCAWTKNVFFFSGFRVWSKERKGGSWSDETGASGKDNPQYISIYIYRHRKYRFSPQKTSSKKRQKPRQAGENAWWTLPNAQKLNTSPTGFQVHLLFFSESKLKHFRKGKPARSRWKKASRSVVSTLTQAKQVVTM